MILYAKMHLLILLLLLYCQSLITRVMPCQLTLKTTLKDSCWVAPMRDELQALDDNHIWELVF